MWGHVSVVHKEESTMKSWEKKGENLLLLHHWDYTRRLLPTSSLWGEKAIPYPINCLWYWLILKWKQHFISSIMLKLSFQTHETHVLWACPWGLSWLDYVRWEVLFPVGTIIPLDGVLDFTKGRNISRVHSLIFIFFWALVAKPLSLKFLSLFIAFQLWTPNSNSMVK